MKIEIDLNDILTDEYSDSETLGESIKRQIVENLQGRIEKGIKQTIDLEISKFINEQIKEHTTTMMPSIINDLIDMEYTRVGRYGEKEGKTTFRNELLKTIQEQMVYKRCSYSSDENHYTRAVNDIIKQQVDSFKIEFSKTLDETTVKDTMSYALSKLNERFNIK